jgi:hypothetical protein
MGTVLWEREIKDGVGFLGRGAAVARAGGVAARLVRLAKRAGMA